MTDSLVKKLENYVASREGNYPFPITSVFAFATVLTILKELNAEGDYLEIGVEFGGTALLLAQFITPKETLHLVDLKKTERFSASLDKLPNEIVENISFHECSSRSESLNALETKSYKFIHIDGGHSKSDVLEDAKRFGGLLAENGILVFDDVYEIRWPGVTEAVNEFVAKGAVVPFFVSDRKLYCCRKEDHAHLLETFKTSAIKVLKSYGEVRNWVEPWMGSPTLIVKFQPNADARALIS